MFWIHFAGSIFSREIPTPSRCPRFSLGKLTRKRNENVLSRLMEVPLTMLIYSTVENPAGVSRDNQIWDMMKETSMRKTCKSSLFFSQLELAMSLILCLHLTYGSYSHWIHTCLDLPLLRMNPCELAGEGDCKWTHFPLPDRYVIWVIRSWRAVSTGSSISGGWLLVLISVSIFSSSSESLLIKLVFLFELITELLESYLSFSGI